MEVDQWMEVFRRAANALYPAETGLVSLIITMERARLTSGIIDEPEIFQSPQIQTAWRNIVRATLEQIPSEEPTPSDILRLLAPRNAATNADVAVATSVVDQEKTIHNERVKLNANFLNSLAVWFAGAGSAGGLISTFVSPSHNFAGAGEVAVIGFVLAVVLKLLANRAIGKLR